jgi:TatD DNase family protein
MRICDSHGHLQMLSPEARKEAIERASAAGVEKILVPGTTVDDSRKAVEIAEAHENVFAAVGIHPHDAKDFEAARDLAVFEELLRSRKTVAIGEIGLDFHYNRSEPEVQRRAFLGQLDFARQRDLPVLLHNRESGEEMLAILEKSGERPGAGVFHSFTENAAFGERVLRLGYLVSFSGMITFKAAENIRDAARDLPLSGMLVETDAPFLSPVPHRGKPCEPAFVVETVRKLAEVKGVSVEEVARVTSANFERLVSIRP